MSGFLSISLNVVTDEEIEYDKDIGSVLFGNNPLLPSKLSMSIISAPPFAGSAK